MIFNDLRVVRDNEPPEKTWNRIHQNRIDYVTYNSKSDITRYAGDIIDYMQAANLLVSYDGRKYYINNLEAEAVLKFINSSEWFDGYDPIIDNCRADASYEPSLKEINSQYEKWFRYVNRPLKDTDFSTDIFVFLSDDSEVDSDGKKAASDSKKHFQNLLKSGVKITTKEIGDFGEALAFAHECARLRAEGADNLIHLIKIIPSSFALGYDISSREADEQHRYIDVKTTISSKPVTLYSFHLTRPEWKSAETHRGNYHIYRYMVSKEQIKLYVISDPVGLYKKDMVTMSPVEGADIKFKPETAGKYEELLS